MRYDFKLEYDRSTLSAHFPTEDWLCTLSIEVWMKRRGVSEYVWFTAAKQWGVTRALQATTSDSTRLNETYCS